MNMSCPGSVGKDCFDMLKSIGFGDWSDFLQVRDGVIGPTLVDLCEVWLGGSLGCKLRDDK